MPAAPTLPAYDVAADFLQSFRSAVARGQLPQGGQVTARMEDELLIVGVRFMPAGSFNPDFLAGGPAYGRPLFTPAGDQYWVQVFELAHAAAGGPDARDTLAAVLLLPEALEAARARMARAAA